MTDIDQKKTGKEETLHIHRETGAAWDIVAKAGYMGDIESEIEFIDNGGVSLLGPELRLLEGLETWCHCALQLQCSGGRDLLSIWNLGAKRIIGLDISETLIGYAGEKSDALNAPASWYCCDVLEAPQELDGVADLVYTGRGALMWMIDLEAWAKVVFRLLKPGGRVLIFEGHPLDNLWERDPDEFCLRSDGASYFSENPAENLGFPSSALKRETKDKVERPLMVERLWRPGQVINALVSAGLEYVHYEEYPDLFWNQFENIPKETADLLPHTYAVMMRKGDT